MRLIDAEVLHWVIRNTAPKSVPLWVYQAIDTAPTAYDAERANTLLETATEEIENLYDRETELTGGIREFLKEVR